MTKPRTVVHIGVGKTGTTTLQTNLFARHSGILNLGRPYASDQFKDATESLREDDEAEYRHAALARLCRAAVSQAGHRAVVLSDETLVHPVHQSVIAARLHAALPDAHILITIRNQYDLIASYWAAHGRILKNVPQPYRGKTVAFADWFEFEAEAKRRFFVRLDFWRLHQIYAEVFGANRVHVMAFEEMADNPAAFARALAVLLGVDAKEMAVLMETMPAKRRPSGAAAQYQALRTLLFPRMLLSRLPGGTALRRAIHGFIEAAPPLSVALTPAHRDIVRERFGPGNKVLAATIGIDLAALRYPMPSDQAPPRHREAALAVSAPGGRA